MIKKLLNLDYYIIIRQNTPYKKGRNFEFQSKLKE